MKTLARIAGISLIIMSVLAVLAIPATAAPDQQIFEPPIVVVNTSFLNVRSGPGANFAPLTTVVGGTELPVLGTAGDEVWYQVSTAAGVGWVNIEFVLPRGDFTNVPLVSVSAPPNVTTIIELPATTTTAGATTTVPTTTTTTSTVAAPNQIIVRAAANQNTNVYAEPSTSSAALTTLYVDDNDTDYPVVGTASNNFIEFVAVDIPGIGVGYIEGTKAEVRLARTTQRDVVEITTGTAALTAGPGGGGSAGLPVLTEGEEGYLLNISPDGQFVQIQIIDGTIGWVPFNVVRTRTGTTTDENPIVVTAAGTAPAPTTTTTTTGTAGVIVDNTLGQGGGGTGAVIAPPVQAANVAVVNTSFLNIRSGPGAQYTQVFTARGGNQFDVVGIASDGVWFLVQGPFGQGWVNNEFVIFRGSIESVPIIRNASGTISTPVAVIGSSVQLYAAPGTNFGLLGSVPGPVEAPIVARTQDFEWVQINTAAGFGWVLASQITIRGDSTLIPIVAG